MGGHQAQARRSTSRTTSSSPPSRWTTRRTRPSSPGRSSGWSARRSCCSRRITRTGPSTIRAGWSSTCPSTLVSPSCSAMACRPTTAGHGAGPRGPSSGLLTCGRRHRAWAARLAQGREHVVATVDEIPHGHTNWCRSAATASASTTSTARSTRSRTTARTRVARCARAGTRPERRRRERAR